jgi:hypothetical protein
MKTSLDEKSRWKVMRHFETHGDLCKTEKGEYM